MKHNIKSGMSLLVFALTLMATACTPTLQSDVHSSVQAALVFEDQVHTRISILSTAFTAALPLVPEPQRAEVATRFADAVEKVGSILDAKDAVLQQALASSDTSADVSTYVQSTIVAIEAVIQVLIDCGVRPAFIANQQTAVRRLTLAR